MPTTKKERIQILILVAAVGLAVLFAGFHLGIRPLFAKKAFYKERIQELTENILKAENKVDRMRVDARDNREALQTIRAETDRYVLRATIGENYLLGVDEMMQRYARAASVSINPTREVGISDVPHNSARAIRNALKAYTAQVSFRGGYDDMLRLLREIETNSPYVCVSAISIAPQPEPEVHDITLDIQWPVWAEKGMAEKLKNQAAEYAQTETKP